MSQAQLQPTIKISDAKVVVYDYETGKKIKKYKLAEILIIETFRKRFDKFVRYREVGLFDFYDVLYTFWGGFISLMVIEGFAKDLFDIIFFWMY